MRIFGRQRGQKAFALPTVLIASVVLLGVLAVSVTATATVRTALQNQYYVQLAQVAGEAGTAYAKACLAANANVPKWSNAKPLTPATDCSGNVILSPTLKALVVAGGGGGGDAGSGGGGGGVLYSSNISVASSTSYPVTVGGGGAGGTRAGTGLGTQGGNSIFSSLTAVGGGYGVQLNDLATNIPGNGGSGGGGPISTTGVATVGGNGTASQGNNGGAGYVNSGWAGDSGGGGGAGGVGIAGGNTAGSGNGGAGVANSISGSSIFYGGGGGGGEITGSFVGAGGAGGGGTAVQDNVGGNGTANTGGGGAGGSYNSTYYTGGTGGTGVVIISYPVDSGITATGVLTAGNVSITPRISGGNKIFTFTGSGTFTVTSTGTSSCPSDPRCSVTVNGNVRSSFSVPMPAVDSNGRALTIPNTGYTQITRTSNGSVWRTYNQPSVQAAVVPDLCSGNATSARGWGQAVLATQQDSLSSASSAQSITIANSAINAGSVYFRKDFNASSNAAYTFNIYTPSSSSAVTAYIDGIPITSTAGSLATVSTTLTAGCHVLVVKLTNQTYLPASADFTASLTRSGAAAPITVSDTSWRVTSGDAVHYSTSSYQETTGAWEPVTVVGVFGDPNSPWGGSPADWSSTSKDSLSAYISTNYSSGAGTLRPAASYAWFRQSQPFKTTTASNVQVTTACDDACDVYLDGNLVYSVGTALSDTTFDKNISIQPGTHTFGVRLYNGGSSVNPSAFIFAAYDLGAKQVIARSDPSWDGTTSWSTTAADLFSYDSTYTPVPAVTPTANAKVLVVGGGGGGGSDMGGGGGGGGVVYNAAYSLTPGTYSVGVGGGGSGALAGAASARGGNGGNSTFGTLRAYGGGGGGSNYAANTSAPGYGGSAGGSAAYLQLSPAAGVIGQGSNSVLTIGAYYPTGGGGAGGPGTVNPATGGVGIANSILGTSYFWGGGGGGAGYTPIGGNGGAGGGGGGAVGTTTGGSGINPGSPGGGGVQSAQTNTPGGNGGIVTGGGGGGGSHYNSNNYGGNGGSGTVIISLPIGTISATPSGSYNDFSSSTPGFNTYLFYGPGTLTVTSIP